MKMNSFPLIEKFNQLKLKARYGVFGCILLAIFGLDVFVVMGFQWGSLQKIKASNQVLHEDIERLKGDVQRIGQMKAGLQSSRSQLDALNMKIRSVGEVSPILEDVSRIANEAGIKIEQLMPQSEQQKALVTSGTIKYYTLPIVVQATSGYHMFGRFMNQLESASLFFTLSQLTIEDQGVDGQNRSISSTFKVVLSDKSTDGPKK